MNVLFLNSYFEPESTAFTHLESDILNELVKNGNEIYVLTPIPTRGISREIVKKYSKIYYENLYDGHVHVRRFWAPQERKNTSIRVLRYMWCALREYQLSSKNENIDVIFANSTPPIQGYLAGKVRKKLKKKYNNRVSFVFDLQDIFPDSLVNADMLRKGSVLWKVGRWIEDRTYKYADQIIAISEEFKKNLIAKNVPDKKIRIIPNWINSKDVYPIKRSKNKLFEKYNLDRSLFYICYSGNIGHSQNLGLLLQVAKMIQSELRDVRFVLIGDGVAKKEMEAKVKNTKINNILFLPFQPYDDIAEVFSLGDIGLIISKPGIGKSSVPSKTWSIMAAETTILASFDENSELSELINKVGCGIVVDAGNSKKMYEGIKKIYFNQQNSKKMGIKGRDYVLEYLDANVCLKDFVDICSKR